MVAGHSGFPRAKGLGQKLKRLAFEELKLSQN